MLKGELTVKTKRVVNGDIHTGYRRAKKIELWRKLQYAGAEVETRIQRLVMLQSCLKDPANHQLCFHGYVWCFPI